MADVLFPTNNFDAAHGGKDQNGNNNTSTIASNNYGRERTSPSLYNDQHYVDGDGFLYGLGMVAQRVLAKPKPQDKGGTVYDGLTNHALKWSGLGNTNITLGLDFDPDAFDATYGLVLRSTWIADLFDDSSGGIYVSYIGSEDGDYGPGSIGIGLNLGKGVYVGSHSQSTLTYNKLNINLFNYNAGNSDVHNDINMSGLEFAVGDSTADGAPPNNQLRVKLYDLGATGSSSSYPNASGLEIVAPGVVIPGTPSYSTSGGLKVKYGTGLTLDNNGNLIADAEAILEDGEGTDVQDGTTASLKINLVAPTVTTSGNTTTKTFGGVKVHDSSLTGSSFGTAYPGYIGVDSSSGEISVKLMSASDYGVAKASAVRAATVTATTGGTTSGRYYGVEIDQAGKLFVNVPWEDTNTWRSIKINHNSTETEVVGSATSTGAIVFFDGTGINVGSGTNSIWFDLQQATASVLGGVKAISYEGNAQQYYDSAIDGVAIDISSTNTGRLHLKLATENAKGVAKLYTSIGAKQSGTDVDIHEDGSVTQLALTNAYNNIMNAIGDLEGVEFKIASSLPTASESEKHYIYLIPISGASAPDAYSEYVCVNKGTSANPNWAWEKIGDTNIDLSGYIQFTDLPSLTLTATEVAAIVSDVFGF